VISERDNVATALETLDVGRAIQVGPSTLLVADTIPRGHKIALSAIPAGDAVVKYGSPIGRASADIAPGAHVHTHNVASARGRGDLQGVRHRGESTAVSDSVMARTAEPPDPDDSESPLAPGPR
jgi:altronate dehydratase